MGVWVFFDLVEEYGRGRGRPRGKPRGTVAMREEAGRGLARMRERMGEDGRGWKRMREDERGRERMREAIS